MTRAVEGGTDQVVAYVRGLIESGRVRPGDRLPAERELALQIGVSRPTVRAGLRALAALGSYTAGTGRAPTSRRGRPRSAATG